jgi:hypothetical protein
MAGQHGQKCWIGPRHPHGNGMTNNPDQQPRKPQPQPQTNRSSQRAVENGKAARCPGNQDRLGQRPMQRHLISGNGNGVVEHPFLLISR